MDLQTQTTVVSTEHVSGAIVRPLASRWYHLTGEWKGWMRRLAMTSSTQWQVPRRRHNTHTDVSSLLTQFIHTICRTLVVETNFNVEWDLQLRLCSCYCCGCLLFGDVRWWGRLRCFVACTMSSSKPPPDSTAAVAAAAAATVATCGTPHEAPLRPDIQTNLAAYWHIVTERPPL